MEQERNSFFQRGVISLGILAIGALIITAVVLPLASRWLVGNRVTTQQRATGCTSNSPTNIAVTKINDTTLRVSWQAGDPYISTYRVQRWVANKWEWVSGCDFTNQTQCTVSGLNANYNQKFHVQADNGGGNCSPWIEVNFVGALGTCGNGDLDTGEICDTAKNCITNKDGQGCATACLGGTDGYHGYPNLGRVIDCKPDCTGYYFDEEMYKDCWSECTSNPADANTKWGSIGINGKNIGDTCADTTKVLDDNCDCVTPALLTGTPVPTATPIGCANPPAPTLIYPPVTPPRSFNTGTQIELMVNPVTAKCGNNAVQYMISFTYKGITYGEDQNHWSSDLTWLTGPYNGSGAATWKARVRYLDGSTNTYKVSDWSTTVTYTISPVAVTLTPPVPTLTPTPTCGASGALCDADTPCCTDSRCVIPTGRDSGTCIKIVATPTPTGTVVCKKIDESCDISTPQDCCTGLTCDPSNPGILAGLLRLFGVGIPDTGKCHRPAVGTPTPTLTPVPVRPLPLCLDSAGQNPPKCTLDTAPIIPGQPGFPITVGCDTQNPPHMKLTFNGADICKDSHGITRACWGELKIYRGTDVTPQITLGADKALIQNIYTDNVAHCSATQLYKFEATQGLGSCLPAPSTCWLAKTLGPVSTLPTVTIGPTVAATPTPKTVACNQACGPTAVCQSGFTCVPNALGNFVCRKPDCPENVECSCAKLLTPTPGNPACPVCPAGKLKKTLGDSDCNDKINIIDYGIWRDEFLGVRTTNNANFNCGTASDSPVYPVGVDDYAIWLSNLE